jgi:hypothetical protein
MKNFHYYLSIIKTKAGYLPLKPPAGTKRRRLKWVARCLGWREENKINKGWESMEGMFLCRIFWREKGCEFPPKTEHLQLLTYLLLLQDLEKIMLRQSSVGAMSYYYLSFVMT